MTDRDGRQIARTAEEPLPLNVNGRGTVNAMMTVNNPRLWSLDDPYLYRVVSVVRSGGRNLDTIKQRCGIRSFRFDGAEGFFLNGQPVKILGTDNHQDHGGLGSALPDYLQYYRIRLLKNMGS